MNKISMAFVVVVFFFSLTMVSASTGNLLSDLVSYYNMSEASGDAVDIHSGKNNITVTGNGWTRNSPGIQGGGLNGTGFNNNLTLPFDQSWNFTITGNLTINFWLNELVRPTKEVFNRPTSDITLYTGATDYVFEIDQLDGTTKSLTSSGTVEADKWVMITLVANGSDILFYKNGTEMEKTSYDGTLQDNGGNLEFRGDGSAGDYINGTIDELGIWNRSLTPNEILHGLYNNGSGNAYSTFEGSVASELTITLNSPLNQTNNTIAGLIFNATLTPVNSNLTNATLYTWFSNGTLFNTTTATITSNGTNSTEINMSNLIPEEYLWNVFGCAVNNTVSLCSFAGGNNTFNYGFSNQNVSHISTVYETDSQAFNISFNVSSGTPTANLWYNGTKYTTTSSNVSNVWTFVKNGFIIPASVGTKNVIWELVLENYYLNISQTQVVNDVNITLCGPGANNVSIINFTFLDEADLTSIDTFVDASSWTFWLGDGSVNNSYTYSNTGAVNDSYAFCLLPAHETVNVDLTFKYSNTSYPQRTYTLTQEELTNSTTDQTLYLLQTADGIYSAIQVIEGVGTAVQGVEVTIERQISGVWTIIEGGITDSSGLVTFWVNPNFDHRITASKTGYTTAQVTIKPSQSLYTLTLAASEGNASYTSDIAGVQWRVSPAIGSIEPGSYNFNATVYSYDSNLENCKLELLNVSNTSQILATGSAAATNTTYCHVGFDYTTTADTNLFGRLSLDTTATDGYVVVNADWKWIVIDVDKKAWRSIGNFFSELKDLNEFGEERNTRDFSRLIFFFLISTILISIFFYFSGVEVTNPGITMIVIGLVILLASAGGFLTFDSASDNVSTVMEQWGFAFIMIVFSFGYVFNTIRRAE